jgi:DNA-damage-inducible protein J
MRHVSKDAYINVRIDRRLKAQAEKILRSVGISTSDVVTMLLRQVVLTRGVPFDVRLPNKETQEAIAELDAGSGEASTTTTRDTFETARKRGERRT